MPAGKQNRDRLVQAAASHQPTLKDTVSILNQGTNTLIALKQLEMQQQGPYDKLSAYGTARGVQDSIRQIAKDANLVRTSHRGAMSDIVTLMGDETLDADSLKTHYEELEAYDVSSDSSGSLAIDKSSALKLAEALVDKKTKSDTMSSSLDDLLTVFEAERTKSVKDGNLVFNASETEFTINNMAEITKKMYAAEKLGLDVEAEQAEKRMIELQKFFYLMDGLKEFDAMDETQLEGDLAQKWDKFIPGKQWDVTDIGRYKTSSGKVITGSVSDALLTSMDLLESGDVKGAEEYYNAANQRRASLFAGEVSRGKSAAKAGIKDLMDKATLARKKFGDNISDLAGLINNQTVGKSTIHSGKGALYGVIDQLPTAAQGTVGWKTMEGQAARNVLSILAASDSSMPGFDSDLNDIAQKWQLEGSSMEDAVMILNQIRKYGLDVDQEEFPYKGDLYDLTNSLYDRTGGGIDEDGHPIPILYTPVGKEGSQLDYPGANVYGKDADTIATQKYMIDVLNIFEKIQRRPELVDIANIIDPDGDAVVNDPSLHTDQLGSWFNKYGIDSSSVQ